MRLLLQSKTIRLVIFFTLCLLGITVCAADSASIDRIQLVNEQISLLKSRLNQGQDELASLAAATDKEIPESTLEKAGKSLLDKASLDIAVSKSNLDSITIEFADCQQMIGWLEKNIEEIKNQLSVLSIFGVKVASSEIANVDQLHSDLTYQQQLLELEKLRAGYLENLENIANNVLSLRNDNYARLNTLLKSRKMLHIKQQQVEDELAYQKLQNQWLQKVNTLYANLAKIDPAKTKKAYPSIERAIFYANENANYAYVESLIARYRDQIQQMKLAILRNNSLSVLNDMGEQVQALNKQITRLDTVLKTRMTVLENHISYLSEKKKDVPEIAAYVTRLTTLKMQYQTTDNTLATIQSNLTAFRSTLDQALQVELSSRQGFPTFGLKTLVDLGKEMLLVPTLTFQVIKSLTTNVVKAFGSAGIGIWSLFIAAQGLFFCTFFFLRKFLKGLIERSAEWQDKINSKWLSVLWLRRNLVDLLVIGNILSTLFLFDVPSQNFTFILYLSCVWLIFKGILIVARLCLAETTYDLTAQGTAGRDMRLYRRLRGIILVGGVITAVTVFIHLLPLVYDLKALLDRLFLLLLMVISLLLLRSWDVVPNLILSQIELRHPYLQKSVRLIGILIPLLIFGNSVIGLFGFLNLIMTVSWYEGIFLIVLIGYLVLRGLLSDGMEQLSRLLIQYVNNGWLWTEAFLKPLDKILRITLLLVAGAVLFLLYGWDKQSPIVERLTRLLHYQLVQVLNTTITPINIIELCVVISIFYWTAKWTREFVYRLLLSRTKDMGIRNSIAILSQYSVIVLGGFFCLRVLGINLQALAVVTGMFALGVGLGLRDLVNNFACGFLILLERPLRVGDIVNIDGVEGEVTHIGGRAVSVRTWDYMNLVVPNTEIFNKAFTNWTAKDNTVRTVTPIKISRHDNPHQVKTVIQQVLAAHKDVLKEPAPEVFLKEITDTLMEFEVRYCVNIRQVKSRISVLSTVLMQVWDAFIAHGIEPPYPQQEIFLRGEKPGMALIGKAEQDERVKVQPS